MLIGLEVECTSIKRGNAERGRSYGNIELKLASDNEGSQVLSQIAGLAAIYPQTCP